MPLDIVARQFHKSIIFFAKFLKHLVGKILQLIEYKEKKAIKKIPGKPWQLVHTGIILTPFGHNILCPINRGREAISGTRRVKSHARWAGHCSP